MTTLETTDLKTRVAEWTQKYADAITQNFKEYSISMLERNLERSDYDYPDYAQSQLDEINNGTANLYWYKIKTGKRFFKIIQMEYNEASEYYNRKAGYREGSVHSFVDRNTGEVFKSASWRGPAKHVRYDMRIIKDREFLHNPSNVYWAGGYLYMR